MSYLKKLKYAVFLSALIMIGFMPPVAWAIVGPLADALDNPVQTDGITSLLFTSSSSTDSGLWSAVTATLYSGGSGAAAQSGPIGNSMYSSLTTTVFGPASVSFYQKVSSQPTYDTLTFSLNGLVKSSISGTMNWQQKIFTLPTGTHTLVWKYTKNANTNGGSDAAWLDKVVVSPNTALKVTYPNGGENLISGSTATIIWNAPAAAEKYDLYYTTNNGTTWTKFASDFTSPDLTSITHSSWTWPVPKVNMTACKVKVVAKNNAGVVVGTDVSDKAFAVNNVRLTAPNGSNVLAAGGSFDITWDSTAAATKFNLSYTLNNGTTWTSLVTNWTGTDYTWSPLPVPAGGNKTTCKVKIVAYNSSNAVIGTDLSDAPFTMQVLKVTAPNGGDLMSAKTGTYTIGFLVSGLTNTSATATISYTINNGSSWPVIGIISGGSAITAGTTYTWDWPVPAVTAVKNAKVKVVIKSASGVVLATDTSDANFTILPVFTISGTVSGATVSGVTMRLGGDDSGTTTTDALGKYSFKTLLKGNYTVSAAMNDFIFFNPAIMALAVTTANITTANFKATATSDPTYTLSGTVSGATVTGVTMTLTGTVGGSVRTDVNGVYSFTNLPEGNYNVMPGKTGYTFDPLSRGVTLSDPGATGIDFTASQSAGATYSISGKTTYNGVGISGATITVSGAASATVLTDAGGNYIVKGLKNGLYIITPSSDHGYDFTPDSVTKHVSGGNLTGVNFTAAGPTLGTLITSPAAPPIVAFTQHVPSQDHTGPYDEIFPGHANVWSLDTDFSLADGFDEQFQYALSLSVDGMPFPFDQDHSELTFYTPLMKAADGLTVATVATGTSMAGSVPGGVLSGLTSAVTDTYAAFLNATSDSRLQQTLDLTSLPTLTTVNLTWYDAVLLDPGAIQTYTPSYQIVIRNEAGTLLSTNPLYITYAGTPSGHTTFHGPLNLSKYAGQKIVLSFELRSSNTPFSLNQAYAIIDSVSVKDRNNNQYVTNGGFETGDLSGWKTNTPAEAQNVTSGARTKDEFGTLLFNGLTVKRSFYTVPNKLWGRWVDVFSNPTAAPITATVTYETYLGSAGAGIIYDPVSYSTGTTPAPKALTSWDSTYLQSNLDGTRDIGLVFGNAATVDFASYDWFNVVAASDIINVTYDITVPAFGRAAIVNFVLMDGTDTGYTALSYDPVTDATARAAEIDEEATKILNNFWTDPQYRDGMTSQQINAIKNF